MPHDHVQKIKLNPSTPKSQTIGHDPGEPMKNPVLYVVRRHTTFGLKIFEIDLVIEI